MREIKYRAWDKVLNKIFEVKAIYFDGEMIGIKTGDESDGEWTVVKKEHVELMQFTGLKDKHGREMYEGDICWDDHYECYGVVKFDEGKFVYAWDNICEDLFEVHVEIIGNIFENPELLEVEQ